MAEHNEIILNVPKELVENCNGFTMDFGGSVLKLVYRHKDDWKETQRQGSSVKTAKLRLRSYSRPDYKEAIELLKQYCYISTGDEPPVLYTTGIGCYEFSDTINGTLTVDTKVLSEMDCFAKSFFYLGGKIPRKDMEYELSETLTAKLRADKENILKMMETWKTMSDDNKTQIKLEVPKVEQKEETACDMSQPIATSLTDMYPCVIAMLGSAFGFFKINADGTFQVLDVSNRGGRSFLGLGSLLLGHTTTYGELLELANKGNDKNVDVYLSDFKEDEKKRDSKPKDSADEDIYGAMLNIDNELDELAFCFGKAAAPQEAAFKKEDVIRAHLNFFVTDLVQILYQLMMQTDIKQSFVIGSFINQELMRDLIAMEFQKRCMNMISFGREKSVERHIHFVKIGAYMGALGALINHTDKFL